MVGLGITVSSFSADIYLFHVFRQLSRILCKFLILALLYALMVSSAVYEPGFIQLPHFSILFSCLFYVFRCVFRVDTELYSRAG